MYNRLLFSWFKTRTHVWFSQGPKYIKRAAQLGLFFLQLMNSAPLAAKHAMCTLHQAGNTHLGLRKMLAIFRQRFVADNDRVIAKQILFECHDCQVGSDYIHCPIPPDPISSSSPWYTLAINVMGPYPNSCG